MESKPLNLGTEPIATSNQTAGNVAAGNVTPGSHSVLSSTPLRIVFGLCLLAFLPEICWAIGLGLESARQGLWPSFWRITTGIVFTVTLFLSPLATLGALVVTVIASRFREVKMGVLALMWLLVLSAGAAEIAHLHGYIGLKKRMPVEVPPSNVTQLLSPRL